MSIACPRIVPWTVSILCSLFLIAATATIALRGLHLFGVIGQVRDSSPELPAHGSYVILDIETPRSQFLLGFMNGKLYVRAGQVEQVVALTFGPAADGDWLTGDVIERVSYSWDRLGVSYKLCEFTSGKSRELTASYFDCFVLAASCFLAGQFPLKHNRKIAGKKTHAFTIRQKT